jgi:predicted flavoprotein YhiN
MLKNYQIAIIGAGPAGLMAAEVLSQHGLQVAVYDAMPSAGRKFLMAGKGGMNITHAEPFERFLSRYGTRRSELEAMITAFSPHTLRDWVQGLGIETFVGSSGRVFPTEMKAAPLLRAWLQRLRSNGVSFHMRHRWLGWTDAGLLAFENQQGQCNIKAPIDTKCNDGNVCKNDGVYIVCSFIISFHLILSM